MPLQVQDGFPYYISLTRGVPLLSLFEDQPVYRLLALLTETEASFAYAPGKWSIKQVLGHITDHERIMSYRALRISRKDNTPLPGYDQELLVANAPFPQLPFQHLLHDYLCVRQATLSLINSLQAEQWQLSGQAWKFTLTVEDFLRATIGHELHHMQVLKDTYLIPLKASQDRG